MTTRRLLTLMLLAAAAACSGDAAGPSPTAQAKSLVDVPSPAVAVPSAAMDEVLPMPNDPGCGHLSATLFGQHEAGKGWVGDALVSFDGGAPESATFLDKGSSHDANFRAELTAGERFWGTETLTLTFPEGTFAEDARYVGVPASTPDLYELHETGTISGTGRFANASGNVAVTGPFLNPLYVETPLWTATMTGWMCM